MKKEMIQSNSQIENKESGFAILLAVLVTMVILSVSLTIISISLRQNILSSTGRESQYAFYAANTIIECAMYWDLNPPVPGPAEEQKYVFKDPRVDSASCAGDNIMASGNWVESGDSTTFTITLSNDHNNGKTYCAEAIVTKTVEPTTLIESTKIEAKGYNTCDESNPRRVERGLEVAYTS